MASFKCFYCAAVYPNGNEAYRHMTEVHYCKTCNELKDQCLCSSNFDDVSVPEMTDSNQDSYDMDCSATQFLGEDETVLAKCELPLPSDIEENKNLSQVDEYYRQVFNSVEGEIRAKDVENFSGKKRPGDDCENLCNTPKRIKLSNLFDNDYILNDIIDPDFLRGRHCPACNIDFITVPMLQDHLVREHKEYYTEELIPQSGNGITPFNIELKHNAFDTYHTFTTNLDGIVCKDIEGLFRSCRQQIMVIFQEYFTKWTNFKVQFEVECLFSKKDPNNDELTLDSRPIPSFMFPCLSIANAMTALNVSVEHFKLRFEEYTCNGSGWVIEELKSLSMTLTKYIPFSGGKLEGLPEPLQDKLRTLIDVPGEGDRCFERALFLHKDINKLGLENKKFSNMKKLYYDKLKWYEEVKNSDLTQKIEWDGIKFPFTLDQIPKFEKQNPDIGLTIIGFSEEFRQRKPKRQKSVNEVDRTINYVVNDFDDEDSNSCEEDECNGQFKKPYNSLQKEIRAYCAPLYVCNEKRKIEVDLLLIMHEDEANNHFVFIRSLHMLLSTSNATTYCCRHCLQCFDSDEKTHVAFCASPNQMKTIFPKDNFLQFKKYCRTQKVPYVIVADFEALCKKEFYSEMHTQQNAKQKVNQPTNTTKISYHKPSGFNAYVIDWKGQKVENYTYRLEKDTDCAGTKMIEYLIEKNAVLQQKMKEHEKEAKTIMQISNDDLNKSKSKKALLREKCHFCGLKFSRKNINKNEVVKHHSHLHPYEFVGFAHSTPCNILASVPKIVPIIFHNLRGYDGHFIIQAARKGLVQDIEVIPQTSEKFMSITINKQLRFIDSALFMPESLSSLVEVMSKDEFPLLRQAFDTYPAAAQDLLLKKGAYPYSYMDSIKKFAETKLPEKKFFKNDLTGEDIDDEVYENAKVVWNTFGIKNMGEWHDLYVKCDTALLADVWFMLRNTLYEAFEQDVSQYFSLPMYSLDAALKMTTVKLEYIKDPTMHVWLESAIRGGLVSAGDIRMAKANNEYLPDYDPKNPTTWIMYWDANNLYGHALCEYLPINGFQWITENDGLQDIQLDPHAFVESITDNSPTGYFLEVDLIVPEEHHDKLNSYPPAPTNRFVHDEDISVEQNELREKLDLPLPSKQKRLIADLRPKENYVCHYRALKTYVKLGCRITKVHRVVKFSQCAWMKPYVEFNTKKRQAATSEIEKRFWKLLNNTGYGKLIEQKRNRRRIQVIMDKEKADRLNKKPTADYAITIREGKEDGLVLLVMKRLQVTLDRPIAAGIAVLDISKTTMFNFHYDYVVPTYPGKHNLLYTDTDSLVYLLQTENVYEDCVKNQAKFFDMSEYDPKCSLSGKYSDPFNKKRLGYFSDEVAKGVISEVIVNKPKMYCIKQYAFADIAKGDANYRVTKKAKGIPKSSVKHELTYEQYKNAISSKNNADLQTHVTSNAIRSYKHQLFTIASVKKAINGYDIKRYCNDGVNTLAYGHKDIPMKE